MFFIVFSVLDLNLPAGFSSTVAKVRSCPVVPRCRSKTRSEQLASPRCLWGKKPWEELRCWNLCRLTNRGWGSSWKHHFSTKNRLEMGFFMKMGFCFFAKWTLGQDECLTGQSVLDVIETCLKRKYHQFAEDVLYSQSLVCYIIIHNSSMLTTLTSEFRSF